MKKIIIFLTMVIGLSLSSCKKEVDAEKFIDTYLHDDPKTLVSDYSGNDYTKLLDILEEDINICFEFQDPRLMNYRMLTKKVFNLSIALLYVRDKGKLDSLQSERLTMLIKKSVPLFIN